MFRPQRPDILRDEREDRVRRTSQCHILGTGHV